MCTLALAEKRKLTRAEFVNCWNDNPEGVGFAWKENNKNTYVKGFMNLNEALKFHEILVPPYVAHFRYASSGGVSDKLTHPFIIGEKNHRKKLEYVGTKHLIFHNGVIKNWDSILINLSFKGIKIEKPYNDTMVVAVMLKELLDVGWTYDEIFLKHELLSGKFIIIDNNQFNMYGDFHDVRGIWFSNFGYLEPVKVTNNNKVSKQYSFYDDDWKGKYDF